MKSNLVVLLALSTLFMACKDEEPPQPPNPFSVSIQFVPGQFRDNDDVFVIPEDGNTKIFAIIQAPALSSTPGVDKYNFQASTNPNFTDTVKGLSSWGEAVIDRSESNRQLVVNTGMLTRSLASDKPYYWRVTNTDKMICTKTLSIYLK